jgi:hypothetical protein
MDYYTELRKFREDRGLEHSCGNLAANICEEIQELLVATYNNDEYETVDALCDIVVFVINGVESMGHCARSYIVPNAIVSRTPKKASIMALWFLSEYIETKEIDNLTKIARNCLLTIKSMGYNADSCMLETCKEINSREGAHDYKAGKWQKFKTPEAIAKWHKADYGSCKNVRN